MIDSGSTGETFEIFTEQIFPEIMKGHQRTVSIGGRIFHVYYAWKDEILQNNIIDRFNSSSFMKDLFRSNVASGPNRIKKPKLMAVINATSDSFYAGSRFLENMKGISAVLEQKPDIIDVGAESTRPGSRGISVEEEISRLGKVMDYISGTTDAEISLDTRHPEVAEKYYHLIDYINDISGFTSQGMVDLAARNSLKCIVMHMKGNPETMNSLAQYECIDFEVAEFLLERSSILSEAGVPGSNIIIDPGLGFAKNHEQNLTLLKNVEKFKFGLDLLIGSSRKSFIGRITGENVEGRLPGSLGVAAHCYMSGVDILRVHDVRETRQLIDVMSAINGSG